MLRLYLSFMGSMNPLPSGMTGCNDSDGHDLNENMFIDEISALLLLEACGKVVSARGYSPTDTDRCALISIRFAPGDGLKRTYFWSVSKDIYI
jgi:hypothetical protein